MSYMIQAVKVGPITYARDRNKFPGAIQAHDIALIQNAGSAIPDGVYIVVDQIGWMRYPLNQCSLQIDHADDVIHQIRADTRGEDD